MNIADIWRYDLRSGATDHPRNGACLFDAGMWLVYGKIGDNPPCSCPVIRFYAMGLNDSMNDKTRHLLKPFILRVVGNRDPASEPERLRYICVETLRRIVPLAFDAAGLNAVAAKLRAFPAVGSFAEMAKEAAVAAWAAWAARAAAATRAAWAAQAARAAWAARAAAATRPAVWPEAISILDGALRIGKQSPKFEEIEIVRAVKQFELARRE